MATPRLRQPARKTVTVEAPPVGSPPRTTAEGPGRKREPPGSHPGSRPARQTTSPHRSSRPARQATAPADSAAATDSDHQDLRTELAELLGRLDGAVQQIGERVIARMQERIERLAATVITGQDGAGHARQLKRSELLTMIGLVRDQAPKAKARRLRDLRSVKHLLERLGRV